MKQICKKCYSINEVDDTNQHYICSKCNKKNRIIPQDNLVFEKFFKKANILFSEQTKYKESAKIFIKLHELQPSNIQVYFGVIFSYLYLSDFNKSYLKEANDFLINNSQDIYLNKKEAITLSKYLSVYYSKIYQYILGVQNIYIKNGKLYSDKNKLNLLENIKGEIIRFQDFYISLFSNLKHLSSYLKDAKEKIEKDKENLKMVEYKNLETFDDKSLIKENYIFINNSKVIKARNILKIIAGVFLLCAFVFMFFTVIPQLKEMYPWGAFICLSSLIIFLVFFFIITQIKLKKNTFNE